MTQLFTWQEKIIGQLLKAKLSFLIIGGYAVNYYGYVRPTGDIDIWLKPDEETKSAFLAMLEKAGMSIESSSHIAGLDFTSEAAFHIGQEPFRQFAFVINTGVPPLPHPQSYRFSTAM
jgi:hypothetical protein